MQNISFTRGVILIVLGLLFCNSITPSTGDILQDVNDEIRIQDAFDNPQGLLPCDHLAYIGADCLVDCWLYEFTLNDPSNLMCTCCGENTSYYSGTWTNNGTIIASEWPTGLVEIYPETCEVKVLGICGWDGLSMDPTTGKLYGALSTGVSGSLWLIDLKNGTLEYIGDFINSNLIIGLAFDKDGNLYGWDVSPDYLYEIDKETGDATSIGSLGININYASDGHFCMEDDILYIAAFTTSPYYGYSLYECDKESGSCTLIGQFEDNTTVTLLAIPYDSQSQYRPHNPIYINGNDNFTSENGVTGGLGTSNDPYIIEGWDINASSHDGITIRNVSIFFDIRDCYIHDGVIGNNDGIVFINVTNGIIEDTTITDNINGVMFHPQHPGKQNSENNDICNNLITLNKYCGINFEHTGTGHHCNNNIFNNTISSNNMGIYMIMSEENQIFYNNFISNGLGISLDMCIGGGDNNKIHQNNFINNSEHAFSVGPNKWFKFDFFKSRGNYWDDWEGLRFKLTRFFPFLLPYKIPPLRFQFDWFPAYKSYVVES